MTIFDAHKNSSYQGRPTESDVIISPQEPPVSDARPYSMLSRTNTKEDPPNQKLTSLVADARPYSMFSRTTPTKEDPPNQKISALHKNHPYQMHDHIRCSHEQLPRKTHRIES
jgi:hypothetical protein